MVHIPLALSWAAGGVCPLATLILKLSRSGETAALSLLCQIPAHLHTRVRWMALYNTLEVHYV